MAQGSWPFFDMGWDPFRWREESFGAGRQGAATAGVFPAINLYDDGESFVVRAELPGMDKDALELTTRGGNQLTIRGARVLEEAEAQASYHRREREGGQFRRTISLPQRVDADRVSASYRDGVLEIQLPRAADAQPRRIQVG